MVAVAITRRGVGDLWLFPDERTARGSPIVHPEDPVVEGADQITVVLGAPSLARLCVRLLNIQSAVACMGIKRRPADMWCLWRQMVASANLPPKTDEGIDTVLQWDRYLLAKERMMADEKTKTAAMAKADAEQSEKAAAVAAGEPAPPKPTKPPVVRAEPKYPSYATIRMGKDAEGRTYGPDHNPKRPGTATHTRFASYKEGMTVEEATKAGLTIADIDWDVGKGFITVEKTRAVA